MSEGEAFVIKTKPITVPKPKLLIGLPDTGLVAIIALVHMKETLGMDEIGYIDSELMPPVILIRKGDPKFPIRVFSKDDLILIIVDTVLSNRLFQRLAKALAKWAKSMNVEYVVGISGLPVPDRLEIDKPNVFSIGTTEDTKKLLSELGINVLDHGFLVGPYALIVKECIREKQPNITLLAQSYVQFPDPGAAASIIEVLNKMLGISIDIKSLLQKSDDIRLRAREFMQRMNLQKAREEAVSLYIR
jgi:uncharacterized protein